MVTCPVPPTGGTGYEPTRSAKYHLALLILYRTQWVENDHSARDDKADHTR